MKFVNLINSEAKAIVSDIDFDKVVPYKWSLSSNGYVRATINKKRLFLHKFLINGKIIDHINGNPLDNRRENLRIASYTQNSANRFKKVGLSIYKGVTFASTENRRKKWKASLEYYGKTVFIGRFLTEEEAAIAYNKKAIEIWGEYAVLNDTINKTQIRGKEVEKK